MRALRPVRPNERRAASATMAERRGSLRRAARGGWGMSGASSARRRARRAGWETRWKEAVARSLAADSVPGNRGLRGRGKGLGESETHQT